jgi:hypothetical protein
MSSLLNSTANPSRFSLRQIAIAAVLVCLGALAAVAMVRETRQSPKTAAETAGGAYAGHQERPALTAEEEAYAVALWPIHESVKANAVRMTFTGLSYKMKDIDRAAVQTQVAPLTKVFREARAKAGQLKVPATMADQHSRYVDALRLYENAAVEMAKISQDGSEAHLVKAQKMSFAASESLLQVGDALWPGEFKPN